MALVGLAAAFASALVVSGAGSASNASRLIAFTRYDGIYLMREDGSHTVPLTRADAASSVSSRLAWSPDGWELAFVSQDAIWVTNGIDLERVFTTAGTSLTGLYSPTWTLRGKIAFTATRTGEKDSDIWIVNRDATDLRRLARTPRLWEFELDWSPIGGRLAFTDIGGWFSRLYVMRSDGSNARLLNRGREVQAGAPQWSPDGRRITFFRTRNTLRSAEIWVTRPDGSSPLRLTRNSVPDVYPTWSPDGTRIAFVRGGKDRPWNVGPWKHSGAEIYVVSIDGSGLTRLTHNKVGEAFPDWQPIARP